MTVRPGVTFSAPPSSPLRVGELAERTGLTVRTLHHYDQIGLLTPAGRSASGYRLYDAGDVERLTKILLLKHLGLALEEIRDLLDGSDDGGPTLGETLALQVERLREAIAQQTRLLRRLEGLAERFARQESDLQVEAELEAGADPGVDPGVDQTPATTPAGKRQSASRHLSVDDLTETLELLSAVEPHFTAEQLDALARRRQVLGEEALRKAESEWPELIANVRAAMARGDDPESPSVQRLAARWRRLVEQFTGGDPDLADSVRSVYRHEPAARRQTGLDPEIFDYVARANAAAREG